jgi:hypothetical protein
MVLWYAPTPLDGSQAIAPLRARVNPMTSKLSGDELDDLIAIAKIDADSYEQQGDAHALRWAKNARNDEMALRELKSARESLREAVGLLTKLSNDDIITASEIADLAKRSRATVSTR